MRAFAVYFVCIRVSKIEAILLAVCKTRTFTALS